MAGFAAGWSGEPGRRQWSVLPAGAWTGWGWLGARLPAASKTKPTLNLVSGWQTDREQLLQPQRQKFKMTIATRTDIFKRFFYFLLGCWFFFEDDFFLTLNEDWLCLSFFFTRVSFPQKCNLSRQKAWRLHYCLQVTHTVMGSGDKFPTLLGIRTEEVILHLYPACSVRSQ